MLIKAVITISYLNCILIDAFNAFTSGGGGWKGVETEGEHLSTAPFTLIQWRCLLTPLTITAAVANFTLRKIRIIPGKIPIHPLGSRILSVPQLSERVREEKGGA